MKTKIKFYILITGIFIILLLLTVKYIPTERLWNGITENDLISDINHFFTTYEENKRLKEQIETIEQLKVEKEIISLDNVELNEIKSVLANYQSYEPIVASVFYRGYSPDNGENWFHSLKISKGKKHGIKENMPVISQNGLIGLIKGVEDDSAEVQLLTSSQKRSFLPAAMKENPSVLGMIASYDPEKNLLSMTNIESTMEIDEGSEVTTSGKSTYFPAGLTIGKVIEVKKDNYGLTNTALIEPAVDFYTINYVIILQVSGKK